MTTTTFRLPRFSPAGDFVNCFGRNHRDAAQMGICNHCGADVARDTDTRKIYDMRVRTNANNRSVYDYCCWAGTHECDPTRVERVAQERDRMIAEGQLVLGQRAIVTRGRKVAKGTEGWVTYIRRDYDFNGTPFTKLGLVDDEGTIHWVKADYCTATNKITIDDVPAPKAAARPTAPRAKGSHADCTHEATKAARAACRKARAQG